MNWEALNAISTAFTGVVILLTVVYAARQVGALNEQSKALGAQIEHLRRATSLDGTLAVFEEIFSADFLAGYQFVITEFKDRINDPQFYEEAIGRAPNPETHKELQIMRHMERIGTLVKNDLLDADVLLDFCGQVVQDTWNEVRPVALEQRRRWSIPVLWENFEFLSSKAEQLDVRRAKARTAAAQGSSTPTMDTQ